MKRPPLFCGSWTDTATGTRIGRATRLELREANRLWWKHRDIREQKLRADDLRAKRGRQGTA